MKTALIQRVKKPQHALANAKSSVYSIVFPQRQQKVKYNSSDKSQEAHFVEF